MFWYVTKNCNAESIHLPRSTTLICQTLVLFPEFPEFVPRGELLRWMKPRAVARSAAATNKPFLGKKKRPASSPRQKRVARCGCLRTRRRVRVPVHIFIIPSCSLRSVLRSYRRVESHLIAHERLRGSPHVYRAPCGEDRADVLLPGWPALNAV